MAGKTDHKTVDLRINGEMEALKQRMADMAKENSSTLPPPPSKNNPNQKFLIFTCRSSDGISGGWGDRQRGMVNTFLLATVTNRRFGIVFNEPCDLRQFYVPNEYNWDVPETELQNKSWKYVKSIDGMPFRNDLYHMDFNKEYPQDVIFLHTNIEHYKAITLNPHYNLTLPVWAQKPVSLLFHDAWNMLFKPTREVQNRVDSFLHKIHFFNRTKPLVGFHVRIGNSSVLRDHARNHKEKLGPVWDFVERYVKNGSQVFLATDNNDIRNTSRVRFGPAHHDTDGVILHIDRQKHRKDACQGFNDLIVEQLMLMHCDILVKSHSGFSRAAVIMRGGFQEIFEFSDADIRPASLLTVT
ncbi:hypothetical protein V1264_024943 [Littorina saxatilis]